MADNEGFMIAEVDMQNGDELIIKGRAYLDIMVGDILYASNVEENLIKQNYMFKVERITSYGKEITKLNSAMTGNLFLKGIDPLLLNNCKMLYKSI